MNLLGELGLEDEVEAGNIIMAARAHWFEDEQILEEVSENKSDDDITDVAN